MSKTQAAIVLQVVVEVELDNIDERLPELRARVEALARNKVKDRVQSVQGAGDMTLRVGPPL